MVEKVANAGSSGKQGKLKPSSLERFPEVSRLLAKLGLGELLPNEISAHPGRNENWSGPTAGGEDVFIKRLAAHQGAERMARMLTFEEAMAEADLCHVRSPRCLGWDETDRVIVFATVSHASTGTELAADQAFDTDLMRRAGRLLAELHDLPEESLPTRMDTAQPSLPPRHIGPLPLERFSKCSGGELQVWSLLQRDQELKGALQRLLEHSDQSRHRPSHCDLRLDQFLFDGSTLYLNDWEEFRRSDPARDLGGFVGDWLFKTLLGINEDDESDEAGQELDHELIMRRGTVALDELRPEIAAFWQAYVQARTETEGDLGARAAAFAGWHLIDRMFAGAQESMKLSAIQKAAAGIGRTLLMNPSGHSKTIGIGQTGEAP